MQAMSFMKIMVYILNNLEYTGFCRGELSAAGGDMKMNWRSPTPNVIHRIVCISCGNDSPLTNKLKIRF